MKYFGLASTLIVVAVQGTTVCVAHIGDGGVVGLTDSGLLLLSGPGDSEYANEVEPLTSDGWDAAVRYSRVHEDVRALAVFTDGCQRAGFRRTAGCWTFDFRQLSACGGERLKACE